MLMFWRREVEISAFTRKAPETPFPIEAAGLSPDQGLADAMLPFVSGVAAAVNPVAPCYPTTCLAH